MIISVSQLNNSFGERTVLNNILFGIEEGEVAAIIGSSGSAKSTLLRGKPIGTP